MFQLSGFYFRLMHIPLRRFSRSFEGLYKNIRYRLLRSYGTLGISRPQAPSPNPKPPEPRENEADRPGSLCDAQCRAFGLRV